MRFSEFSFIFITIWFFFWSGYGKGKSHGRGGRRVGGGNQSRAASDSGKDVVTKRLLSASHQKIKDLQNEVEDLRRQMKIIIEENKLYKRLQHKQVDPLRQQFEVFT